PGGAALGGAPDLPRWVVRSVRSGPAAVSSPAPRWTSTTRGASCSRPPTGPAPSRRERSSTCVPLDRLPCRDASGYRRAMAFPRRLLIEGEELVLDLRPPPIALFFPALLTLSGLVAAVWISQIDAVAWWIPWGAFLV